MVHCMLRMARTIYVLTMQCKIMPSRALSSIQLVVINCLMQVNLCGSFDAGIGGPFHSSEPFDGIMEAAASLADTGAASIEVRAYT